MAMKLSLYLMIIERDNNINAHILIYSLYFVDNFQNDDENRNSNDDYEILECRFPVCFLNYKMF